MSLSASAVPRRHGAEESRARCAILRQQLLELRPAHLDELAQGERLRSRRSIRHGSMIPRDSLITRSDIEAELHRVPMDRTIWVHIGATGPMNGQAQLGLGH